LSTSKSFICEQFNEAVRTLKKSSIVCMEVTSCKQNNKLKKVTILHFLVVRMLNVS